MKPAIETVGLTRLFGKSSSAAVTPVDRVNLSIALGEFVAIMGPSGSGKSTLLSILGCLDTPTAGSYSCFGAEIGKMRAVERARFRSSHIGFIFQNFSLLQAYSVLENVELPFQYHKGSFSSVDARRAIDLVGLSNRIDHRPGQLSGGQQQRVAIARALVMRPPLILADEPTGALDSSSAEVILDLLSELHTEERTIVMVTHDPHIATRADRILHYIDGRICS